VLAGEGEMLEEIRRRLRGEEKRPIQRTEERNHV
jgi:hypothetical protein